MKRTKIFGAGAGGSNAVLHLQQNNIVDADYCLVCSGFCPSEYSVVEHICLFGEQQYVKTNSHDNDSRFIYNLGIGENYQKIETTLTDNPELLVVIVGLSGSSGTCITEMICQVAQKKNIPTHIIATLPYNFEGEKRMIKAHRQLDILNQLDVPIHVIHAESVFENYPTTDISSSFPNLDKIISDSVISILEKSETQTISYKNIEFETL